VDKFLTSVHEENPLGYNALHRTRAVDTAPDVSNLYVIKFRWQERSALMLLSGNAYHPGLAVR